MFNIDETYLTQTLTRLVQIDSRNPSLTPGCPGEAEIGAYIAEQLEALGLEVNVDKLVDDRVNVVGILRGTGGGRSLMLNGHMDTVAVEGMAEPFSGAIRDGKLYGRGSQDMKGSLAAMLATVKALVDADIKLAGDLLITAVADEEYASIGTEDIAKRYTADAAIVTEPTDLTIARAHRGFVWFDVAVQGRAAHGSRFAEGIDANMRMGRFLAELDKLEQELRQRPPHPLTGPPSLHAALLKGGTAVSVYADSCTLKIERRTNPGETVAQATAEIQEIIDRLAANDPTFKATVTPFLDRITLETGADAAIVKIVEAAASRRLGQDIAHTGGSYWTDAALLAEVGIESILFGPIGAGLHSVEEWVDVQSVVDTAHILTETAIEFCGISK